VSAVASGWGTKLEEDDDEDEAGGDGIAREGGGRRRPGRAVGKGRYNAAHLAARGTPRYVQGIGGRGAGRTAVIGGVREKAGASRESSRAPG